ncbi:hypothetical protein [Pseudomonas viridiflava]|uniref:hypothetical protein n=1 Tax=Pseudomonas viridiflava TaxID=33069 RepID=UPI000F02F59B|nr:hypothetical protein [Pseudomonas viridiflava]MDY0915917.1 hypothetical protein [Pseudomonas viridiflava]MEE4069831.1 hypothetical protein [Pseudomonas viridiflava]
MAVPAEFNAAQWFSDNTAGGSRLTPETQHSIADFTTMWNFFEGNLCRNEGNVPAFESVADRYRPSAEQHQNSFFAIRIWAGGEPILREDVRYGWQLIDLQGLWSMRENYGYKYR